jgi:hypothetical protein
LLYVVVSVIGGLARGRQGAARGAGAPWPQIPPVEDREDMTDALGTPERPAGSSEACPSPPARSAPDIGQPPSGVRGKPGEGGQRMARRCVPAERPSDEGTSLEWAEEGIRERDGTRSYLETAWGGTSPERRPTERPSTTPAGSCGARTSSAVESAGRSFTALLTSEELVRAIVLAEVLGPPLARRRRARL